MSVPARSVRVVSQTTTRRPRADKGDRPGFRCTECGWTATKWVGRCGECQEWGTVVEDAGPPPLGMPDDEISTWVDTRSYAGQKFDALAAHASQADNTMFLRMGRERFTELMGVEAFLRVHDSTNAPLPEDDLFAGLR